MGSGELCIAACSEHRLHRGDRWRAAEEGLGLRGAKVCLFQPPNGGSNRGVLVSNSRIEEAIRRDGVLPATLEGLCRGALLFFCLSTVSLARDPKLQSLNPKLP